MNIRTIAIVSLGLNLVLAALWLGRGRNEGSIPSAVNHASPAPPKATHALRLPSSSKLDWRTVESEDYKLYIGNLRSIGCPEETIRDIIVADVNKLFESRAKESRHASAKRFEYWKPASFFTGIIDEEKLAKQKEVSKEKQALIKELLGVDIPEKLDPMAGINPYEAMLDFLPPDKQSPLMEIEQKYSARLMKTMKDVGQGDFSEMKKTTAEKEAELAILLSSGEKFEYDLRLSQSAMAMRMALGDVEPTEQEFRAMFVIQKKFDDEFGLVGMQSNDKAQQRDLAHKELERNFKSILGEERFYEYKYGMEWNQSGLKQFAADNKIPKTAALKILDIRDTALTEMGKVEQNAVLSPEQRQTRLKEVRNTALKEIGNEVGPDLVPRVFNQPDFAPLRAQQW